MLWNQADPTNLLDIYLCFQCSHCKETGFQLGTLPWIIPGLGPITVASQAFIADHCKKWSCRLWELKIFPFLLGDRCVIQVPGIMMYINYRSGAAVLRKSESSSAPQTVHSRPPTGHSLLLAIWIASKNIFNEIFIEFQFNVPT